jgi:hypothetical protein
MTATKPLTSSENDEQFSVDRNDYQELNADNRAELLAQIAKQRRPGEKFFLLVEDEVRTYLHVVDELQEVVNFLKKPPCPLVRVYIVSGFQLLVTQPPERHLVTPWKVLVPLFQKSTKLKFAEDGRVVSRGESCLDQYPEESEFDDEPFPPSPESGTDD